MDTSDVNPDLVVGAPEPVVKYVTVEKARVYTEDRGSGPPVLIVGAADEDAEIYRGVAERLADTHRVVTYDRRGTGRSDSAGWPSNSARHADDAAKVIQDLNLGGATVLGASAGGIVALRLALRHPDIVTTVLCFEPGVFSASEAGEALRVEVVHAVEDHLRKHPADWVGASAALGHAAVSSFPDRSSLFTPPPGREWFFRHAAANAASLIRGDIPLTGEHFDANDVATCSARLRFSHGTASLPVFADIATTLAAYHNDQPDVLEGVSHALFLHPSEATEYIAGWA